MEIIRDILNGFLPYYDSDPKVVWNIFLPVNGVPIIKIVRDNAYRILLPMIRIDTIKQTEKEIISYYENLGCDILVIAKEERDQTIGYGGYSYL